MAQFLHIADVHLGFDRYESPERTKDFFRAFYDVIQRHAIDKTVDFVLLVGDLFEHRNIQPATLNQAQICLQALQSAGIPVLAIEGNHDNRPYGTRTSWLKYLSEWGLLKLLEPGDAAAGEPFYSHWDEQQRRGGYVDLACGVRVLGSSWYGAAAPQAIEQVAAAIADLPPGPEHTVLMFHHGLEGQIARYAGALRYGDLLPLKQAGVDYLALGHIHKQYEVENWVFNPGSLEANNVEEAGYTRGAYWVELSPQGVQATLKTDYVQRPVIRLDLSVRGQESPEDLVQAAKRTIDQAIREGGLDPAAQPFVELKISGQVSFERFDIDIRSLQKQLQEQANALIFLLRYDVEEASYASPVSDAQSRLEIEESIFADLLVAHRDYKHQASTLAKGLIDLKDQQLSGRSDPELFDYINLLLNQE